MSGRDPARVPRSRLAVPAARLFERRREAGAGLFVAVAVAAHVLAVGTFVALPRIAQMLGMNGAPPASPPPATIEMIEQNTANVGASHEQKDARAASKAAPARHGGAPTPVSSPNADDEVAANDGQADAAQGPTSSEQADPQASDSSVAAPRVDLDLDDGAPGTGLVDGPNVIPASPDARHPNLPPSYPRAAAMRGEQGTVGMLISIGPDGRPTGVQIASSSGYPDLDAAAQRAVQRWHFRPGQQDGHASSSVFNQQITFELNGHPP